MVGALRIQENVSGTLLIFVSELEKSMAKDALKTHLAKRPEKETLVQRMLLQPLPGVWEV